MGGIVSGVTDTLGITEGKGVKSSKAAVKLFDENNIPQIGKLKEIGDARNFIDKQQGTAYGSIKLDPATRQAQMQALQRLQQYGEGGLTAQDKAQLEEVARQENIQSRGAREAITQNARARGVGGSGLELAQQIGNQQASADSMRSRGTQIAGGAQNRAFQAIQAQGQLGGDIRNQDFGQAAEKARAMDAINQFNANARSQAGLATFQNRQNISNANIREIPQQNFNNSMDVRSAKANALQGLAGNQNRQSDRLGSTIGAGLSALSGGLL